jgi:Kef-type K+ transport system membrane component KefB
MTLIWGAWAGEVEESFGKALTIGSVLTAASAQAAGTTARRRASDSRTVTALYATAIVLSLAVAALVAVAMLSETENEAVFRAIGALVVADLLFLALQFVVRRAGPQAEPREEVATLRVSGPADAIEAAIPDLERRGLTVERER